MLLKSLIFISILCFLVNRSVSQRFGVGEVKNPDDSIENTSPEMNVERQAVELEVETKEEVLIEKAEPETTQQEKIDDIPTQQHEIKLEMENININEFDSINEATTTTIDETPSIEEPIVADRNSFDSINQASIITEEPEPVIEPAVVESTITEPVVEPEPVVEEAHPPAPPANKFEIEADSLNQDKLKDFSTSFTGSSASTRQNNFQMEAENLNEEKLKDFSPEGSSGMSASARQNKFEMEADSLMEEKLKDFSTSSGSSASFSNSNRRIKEFESINAGMEELNEPIITKQQQQQQQQQQEEEEEETEPQVSKIQNEANNIASSSTTTTTTTFTTDSNTNTNILNTGAMNDMEARLRKQLLAEKLKVEEEKKIDPDVVAAEYRRKELEGYKLPRESARPIERILRLRSKSKPNWYKILSVSKDSSSDEIAKAYKYIAKEIHPEGNPHPLAGDAFEIIKEAVSTLTNLPTRAKFDAVLDERLKPLSIIKKMTKMFKFWCQNTKSRLLLFITRINNNEIDIEIEAIKEYFIDNINNIKTNIFKQIENFMVIPGFEKVKYLIEYVEDHKVKVGVIGLIIGIHLFSSLLLTTKRGYSPSARAAMRGSNRKRIFSGGEDHTRRKRYMEML